MVISFPLTLIFHSIQSTVTQFDFVFTLLASLTCYFLYDIIISVLPTVSTVMNCIHFLFQCSFSNLVIAFWWTCVLSFKVQLISLVLIGSYCVSSTLYAHLSFDQVSLGHSDLLKLVLLWVQFYWPTFNHFALFFLILRDKWKSVSFKLWNLYPRSTCLVTSRSINTYWRCHRPLHFGCDLVQLFLTGMFKFISKYSWLSSIMKLMLHCSTDGLGHGE